MDEYSNIAELFAITEEMHFLKPYVIDDARHSHTTSICQRYVSLNKKANKLLYDLYDRNEGEE